MASKKFRNKQNVPKTRKQLRREERKNKKIRRHEYYTNRKKPGQFVRIKKDVDESAEKLNVKKPEQKNSKVKEKIQMEAENMRDKERKQQKKLQKEMDKQRNKQLVEANLEEDRNIKRLEKQLKLHKRKSKSVPTSFARDGLDYLLEVCDSENLEKSVLAEQQLAEVNDDFEEDLVLMMGGSNKKNKNKKGTSVEEQSEEMDIDSDGDLDELFESEDESMEEDKEIETLDNTELQSDESSDLEKQNESKEMEDVDIYAEKKTAVDSRNDDQNKINSDGTWEDIYGRLRAADGSIINANSNKYIPPAARLKLEDAHSDKIRSEKLQRLKKQLKGLINRLAESNMHNIATQIEELYMNNSRNDMNSTITNLILEAIACNILTPERLLMEHVLLITILHANIGTEVGAHFLEAVAKLFFEHLKDTQIENKRLDNVVVILSQLYNFKLFDCKLVYEILDRFSEKFDEKSVECILHILKNVGFNLRKDDPLALKKFIMSMQKKASEASEEMRNNSRIKFMLDILLAIKNNNVSKIPNYDTGYSEHLKKIMKSFIRKGNYVTQLNISLDDLLKAEEKGKWWVIGSAWTGKDDEINTLEKNSSKQNSFSQKLLDLASKQRMNTDARRNIFCIIMSAEDYLDAFEKLLKLGLKNQQEREIIYVILHCCLQEKIYNPYYAALALKFCEYDRKYQMTIKYSIWDKLKALKDQSVNQISNLAKLLSHLFIEKGLSISILKIIQFSELDKVTLRFLRQILLGILLHEDLEACKGVFEKVAQSEKLKMFRESLRLFLHHFLLKKLNVQDVSDVKKELLLERFKLVEKQLTGKIRYM